MNKKKIIISCIAFALIVIILSVGIVLFIQYQNNHVKLKDIKAPYDKYYSFMTISENDNITDIEGNYENNKFTTQDNKEYDIDIYKNIVDTLNKNTYDLKNNYTNDIELSKLKLDSFIKRTDDFKLNCSYQFFEGRLLSVDCLNNDFSVSISFEFDI